MIVDKTYSAVCRGCNKPIILRRYVGIPDGLYGDHSCATQEEREKLYTTPKDEDLFTDLKEIPNGTDK